MLCAILGVALAALGNSSVLSAQPRVDPRVRYERIITVQPMIGAGTPADPRRPMFVPLPPKPGEPLPRTGIAGFSYVMSDDGKFAICEFVARDRASLLPVLNNASLGGKVFERGKAQRADIERELKKYKKDLDLDKFGGVNIQ